MRLLIALAILSLTGCESLRVRPPKFVDHRDYTSPPANVVIDNGIPVNPQQPPKKEKPVFRIYSADWCTWCTKLKRETEAIQISGKWKDLEVHIIDSSQTPLPRVELVDEKGTVVHKFTGYKPKDELIKLVKKHLKVD